MITFTASEIAWMATDPECLRSVANYHDWQQSQGESMGFDCSANEARWRELRAEADRLQKEYEA